MAKIGIVGNGADKFTALGQERAYKQIFAILCHEDTLVSGHSPVGGVDIWAEEVARTMGAQLDLKIPDVHQWNPVGRYGYRARNIDIADSSDIVHVIVADEYPQDYHGRRFPVCYHCAQWGGEAEDHVKSGGCWTGYKAKELGKEVYWHVIPNQ
jgi:hypothetical protein